MGSHSVTCHPTEVNLPTLLLPRSNLGRARFTIQQSPHWLQWDAPRLPPKLPLFLRRSLPHLIHPSLDRPRSPSQTTPVSNQPFCHSTLSGQTDRHTRQTNTWDRRQVCKKSAYPLSYWQWATRQKVRANSFSKATSLATNSLVKTVV